MVDPDIKLVETSADAAIGIADNLAADSVLHQAITLGLRHIVQKNNPDFERAMACSRSMLQDHKQFLDFPLSVILRPDQPGAESEKSLTVFEFNFDRAAQKPEMLAKLSATLGEQINKVVLADIALIADELFSNACFNAPYPTPGAQTNEVSRQCESVQNTPLRPGKLSVGLHGDQIAIACRDAYGTLDTEALLKRLLGCFREGADKSIKTGQGGAGLGSLMVYGASSGFFTGVEKGKRTVVASIISKNKQKNRLENNKTLHFFSKENGE